MTIIISSYKIFRYFGLKGKQLYIPLMIVCFHPAFILFSGSVNNDALSVALMMGAILCTLEWYRTPSLKNILKIALCVGLGMMTKITVAIVAPPIALIFLYVFVCETRKERGKWKQLLTQFVCFGAVSMPLGLWFPIRSYIKWQVPLLFVYRLDPDDSTQYVGDRSFWSRITDFSAKQFNGVYERWLQFDNDGNLVGYSEYNPLIALLKTALFGENIDEADFVNTPYINRVAVVFFLLGTLIALAALVCMAVMCFRKCRADVMERAFFVVLYVLFIVIFYKGAYDYPFTCTMNFRYLTPTVTIGALFLGLAVDKLSGAESLGSKIVINITGAAALLFAVCSGIIYLALG